MGALSRQAQPCARVDNDDSSCLIPRVTTNAQPKRPEYAPSCGLTRFQWILLASQALRDQQPERIAAEIESITERARTHGHPQDRREG